MKNHQIFSLNNNESQQKLNLNFIKKHIKEYKMECLSKKWIQ